MLGSLHDALTRKLVDSLQTRSRHHLLYLSLLSKQIVEDMTSQFLNPVSGCRGSKFCLSCWSWLVRIGAETRSIQDKALYARQGIAKVLLGCAMSRRLTVSLQEFKTGI